MSPWRRFSTSAVVGGGRRPSRRPLAMAETPWSRRRPGWLGKRFARGAARSRVARRQRAASEPRALDALTSSRTNRASWRRSKAIPYGVYDMARNEAWVSVGRDHDTPAFAVASIRHWWREMGRRAYPKATTLYITADAGGKQRLPVPGLEARASAIRRPDRPDHRGEPFPTRHEQVEQESSTGSSATSRRTGAARRS